MIDPETATSAGVAVGTFLSALYGAYRAYKTEKEVKTNGYKCLKEEQIKQKNEIEKIRRGQIYTARKVAKIENYVTLLLKHQGIKVDENVDIYSEVDKMLGES